MGPDRKAKYIVHVHVHVHVYLSCSCRVIHCMAYVVPIKPKLYTRLKNGDAEEWCCSTYIQCDHNGMTELFVYMHLTWDVNIAKMCTVYTLACVSMHYVYMNMYYNIYWA